MELFFDRLNVSIPKIIIELTNRYKIPTPMLKILNLETNGIKNK